MGICLDYNIKLEKADEKGMVEGDSMIYFLQKAKSSICEIKLSKDLIKANNINIILNGQTKTLSLNQRKIWTDEIIDFTCIEIKEKEDNIYTFFNLDDNVFTNELYLNQNVIIYGIKDNKIESKLVFSNGKIKNSKNKDNYFAYTCNTYPGCSGGCIVNQYDNCVIGIHKGEIKGTGNKNAVNAGIFIRDIIKYIKENKYAFCSTVN